MYFGNPSGIQNILTRVTGGNASSILGTLGVDGGANLFLLNPNGIIFGQNARLDLRGSFVGTTANAIGFGEQGFFSATDPNSPPLLTVQPSALLYTQINGASIVSKSIAPAGTSPGGLDLFGLRVPDGQSLLLVGGDVQIDGGGISGGLIAQGGRIELGGLAQTGDLALDNNFKLTYPDNLARANVSLVNGARVSVRGNGGGDVVVNANDFTATNGGRLVAGTEASPNAGDITVNASTVNFVGVGADGLGSGLFNQVLENATGNGGSITVNTNSLNASSGAKISASTSGIGDAGNVLVQALDSLSVAGNSYIQSNVESGAVGSGGSINITAPTLSLTDGAQVQTLVRDVSESQPAGEGIAGDVNVNVSGDVTISGVKNGFSSGIFSYLGGGGQKAKGGTLMLKSAHFL